MSPLPPNAAPKLPAPSVKDANQGAVPLAVVLLEDRIVPAGQVTGTVFLDFNANGLFDSAGTVANAGTGSTPIPGEDGVATVVVTAFDAGGTARGSATTAANGTYTLNMTGTGPYRLEFTNLPAGLFYGPQSAAGGANTGVQFVGDGNTANVNLSVADPARTSPDNPNLLSNVYVVGEVAGNAVVRFAYNSGTQNSDTTVGNYALNTPTSVADNTVVGATWGLAFDNASNRAFAAAFTKRHTAFGIGGPGAIYTLDPTGATAPTLFADLNALTGNAAAGANFRPNLGTGYDYTTDLAAFDQVGKSGLGGLAVDDTGTFMYTVGLASRQLYRIRIPANGASPTAADVTAFNIPLPASVTGVNGPNGPLGDFRPFAVEFHNGIAYVGAVNSAETTGAAADLQAYVFAFSPTANAGAGAFVTLAGAVTTTQPVFTQALNYPRGFTHLGDQPPNPSVNIPGEWNPWTATRVTLADSPRERYAIYPQPELTGLAFDSNGNMTLGLRDRNGDQYGNFLTVDFPGTSAPGTKGITAGDTLRAAVVTPGDLTSGWTPENITAAPPSNITGPTAGGQFYWQQDLPPDAQPGVNDHQAVSVGGVLQLRGRDQVLVTGFDPIHIRAQYDLGGVRWFDTTGANAGGINKAFQVYQNTPTTFAKSNGIGDLIAASPLGREIGNRIWNDANGNGRQDPGEAGIQSVRVVLVRVVGSTVTPLATATTDANGDYYFGSYSGTSTDSKKFGIGQIGGLIPAGTSYEVRVPVSDPALAGLQLTTATAGGTNPQNDSNGVLAGSDYVVTNVAAQRLGASDHASDIGLRVAPTGQLSGFVYEDANRNSQRDAGTDPAIGGVTVVLTGVLSAGSFTPRTTTTDGTGFYQFTGLAAGTYTVTETQPAGYLDFNDQAGSTGGNTATNDVISTIPLANGGNSQLNNFGEVRAVQLSGFVYHDINNDGDRDVGTDAAIVGVTVVLTGVDDRGSTITPATTTTDGTGAYAFTGLRPGDYTVTETQPANFTSRTNNPGTVFTPGTGTAGTVSGDAIQTIVLNSNANSPDNNFGEVLSAGGQLSGFVYEDNDRSSSRNGGDAAIAGVTVVLTGTLTAGGSAISPRTTTTDGTGFYQFTSLQPGSYTVTETQPGAFLDFNEQAGTTTGNTTVNDVISAIPVDNGVNSNSQNNNFGEVRPVQLSGFVYEDVNDDGDRDVGTDAAIAGVTVVLTGVDDRGSTITPATTTTDGTGAYAFTGLRPGDYTVTETQPANFTSRTNNPGTVFTPGTGTAGTVAGDAIQTIRLNSNANSPDNNFGETRIANAQLSGFVYEDANRNSQRDAGTDPAIGGVTVVLTGTPAVGGTFAPRTTTTDGTGFYQFTGLAAGTYTVTETQPAGYLDFNDQAGTTSGNTATNDVISAIPLTNGGNSQLNNFGEVRAVQVSGVVYEDVNSNGSFDAGTDTPLPTVTLVLSGTDDRGTAVLATSVTDGTGAYAFTGLRPGTYTVTETQPAGFVTRNNTTTPLTANGNPTPGTPGTPSNANDNVSGIVLNSGAASPNNNFGEVRRAQLSGVVYHDVNTNNQFDGGTDTPLANVTLVLTGTDFGGNTVSAATSTNGAGQYAFTNLLPGTYTVTETQPPAFQTQNNTPGTAFTPGTGTAGTADNPNDRISGVVLNSNANNPGNNFGETLIATGQLSGFVYEDNDRSNSRNTGDADIGGVTVVLTGTRSIDGAAVAPRTTTTDGTGFYQFTALAPGNYTVSETQPAGYLDFNEQAGTTTGNTSVNDVISAIPVNNNNSQLNNFGEVRAVQLSGFVYEDVNNDGVRNAGDADLAGVTVVLTGVDDRGSTITPATTTTSGTGSYAFTALRPGDYTVTETQPANYTTRTNNPGTVFTPGTGTAGTVAGDAIQTVRLNSNANSPDNNFGEVRTANGQVSGFVYEDVNRNSQRDAGTDTAIGGVTVVLTGTPTLGGTITARTTTTAADGSYSFTGLIPGNYTVTEAQPAGFLDFNDQFGSTGGNTATNDVIAAIPVDNGANVNSTANNFGEVRAARLSGFVYHDITPDGTGDGVRNAGDADLGGVTVVLTGVDDLGATISPRTTTTSGTGFYEFTALRPGDYTVTETQPANFTSRTNNPGMVFAPGTGTAGTVAGDAIQTIRLNSNADSVNNNFGEVLSANASLSGFVYEDNDRSSSRNGGDGNIGGVTVVLTGTLSTGGTVSPRTTTTAADGSYSFATLQPGTYTVTETQPAGFLDFNDQFGSTGGNTATNDVIAAIPLASAANSQGNNFGEVRPAQLSGRVYHDVNDNGVRDAGDTGLAGVTVVLTGVDDRGATITPITSTTLPDGTYSFAGLRPGDYTVSETQPADFVTRVNAPGTAFAPGTGTAGTVNGDRIQTVRLNSNANNPNNDFGEVLAANAALGGFVYEDANNSNTRDAGDPALAGVTVVLTGTLSTGQTITPRTTTTGADGGYTFGTLRPGTYSVTERQPAGLLSRGEQPGTTGGTAPQNGVLISAVPLGSRQTAANNNFGEVRPARVSGVVYHDLDDNGAPNAGDASLPGVTVVLTGVTDLGTTVAPRTTTTDGNGRYAFADLRPGTYAVSETQPAGFTTRANAAGAVTNGTAGTVSGDRIQTIVLRSNGNAPNNNFGEIIRNNAVISGFVYRDQNLNGAREAGAEPGLGGVTVRLFREDGPGVLTPVGQALTDSTGFYQFTGLAAGTYRLVETQPAGLYSTGDTAGTTGGNAPGNDTITTVPLRSSQNSRNNNFGEAPPTNLFGYVWVDQNRNGVFDPGEAPIPGAVVNVGGTAFNNTAIAQPLTPGLARAPLTATTDANGRYEFLRLPPGVYNLAQTNTPAGFQDFRSQNASGQTVQTSTATSFGGVAAQTPAQGPLNFGKVAAGATVTTLEPSKQNFLGSSVLTAAPAAGNPLVGPATVPVNTTPPFAVTTGNPARPAPVVAAAGAGFTPVVRVFDYATGVETFRFQAFESGMTAGVRATTGDVSGDGVPDIVAVAGPGSGPRVRIFNGTDGSLIRDFFAYPPEFRGGLYVATGDFNNDGRADIVTGAGEGGGPNVRVFDGVNGTLITSFFAFDSAQRGGARVAVGDFNGDGKADIAASNGPGNTSLVRVFNGVGFGQLSQFTPYTAAYTGGVFLAAGDLDGDGRAELVTGADQGGGPNVRFFNALTGQLGGSFFAYESGFTGGVRVTVRDITGDGRADIITGAGIGGASRIRAFSGANLQPVEEFFAFDSGVRTGIFLG